MTSIDTWPLWITIIVAGGPTLLSAISTAYSLYLSHHYLDTMMEALKNSRYIYLRGAELRNKGPIGSMLVIAKIAGMILLPKASLRIGELDPSDLDNFPPYLKRMLKIDATMIFSSVVWAGIAYALVKYR